MGVNETFKMKAFMEESLVMVNVGLKGTLGPKDFCFCLPDASGKRVPLSHSLLHGLLGPCASVLPFCILDAFTQVVFFPQYTVTVMHWLVAGLKATGLTDSENP